MTYSFPVSFADHYAAYRTAFHRKPAAWIGYVFFIGLPLVVAGLAIALRGWTFQDLWQQQWYLLIGGPLFALVVVPLLHLLNVRQQRSGNAALTGQQSITFSPDGFRAWGDLQNTSVLWPGIHAVVETRRYFLFYLSEVHFFFLPKAIVPDASELRALLREHIGERARLAA
jgi:YcxB-like protein